MRDARFLIASEPPDRNCELKCVQRLLQHHAYEPILFSSAQAFKSDSDFDRAACIILDINLSDGSGIELSQGLKADGVSVPT
jgi:FixJ family two-component response regulator